MRAVNAALVVTMACVGLACAKKPNQSVFLKGPPRYVEVNKQAGASTTEFRAVRAGDGLRVTMREVSKVELERRVKRSTFVIEGRGKPKWEVVELLLGIPISPLMPVFYFSATPREDGPELKMRFPYNPLVLFIDPTRTLLGNTMTGRLSQRDMFTAPPTRRSYRVALPVADQALSYRVISAARTALAEGEATTSRFGEIEIEGVGDDAVGVEVNHGGKTSLIVIE